MSENATFQPTGQMLGGYSGLTEKYLKAIGIGLLVAFIFPVITSGYRGMQFMFANIEGLGQRAPFMVKVQLIYPLIAGIILLVIAGKARNAGKAGLILILGLLPFLLLLASPELQRALSRSMRRVPGFGSMGTVFLLSFLADVGILAGAHQLRVNPKIKIGSIIASLGAGLWIIKMLIPIQGQFMFIAPFQIMFARDRSGAGILFVLGLAMIISMVLMVMIVIKCFTSTQPKADRGSLGAKIIKLWWYTLLVWSAVILYFMILGSAVGGRGIGGMGFLAFITILIKFVPWFLGLYLLIPIGVSEFLLLSPEESTPAFASATAPPQPGATPAAPPPPPTPQPPAGTAAPQPEQTMEQRLQELSSMKEKGLINDEDYEKKKNDILSKL